MTKAIFEAAHEVEASPLVAPLRRRVSDMMR